LTAELAPGSVVLAENPATNLAIAAMTKQASVWANRFGNKMSEEEALDRLAFHARVFGWTEEEFVKFMAPGRLQFDTTGAPIELTLPEARSSGLGYWLVYHRRSPSPQHVDAGEKRAREAFRGVSVQEAIRRFRVQRILSHVELSNVNAVKTERTPFGYLYFFAGST
jgi:hypothetical protein